MEHLHDLSTDEINEAAGAMPPVILSEERARLVVKIIETNRRSLRDAFRDG